MASRGAREGGRAHLLLAQWRRASRQLVTSGGAFGAYFFYFFDRGLGGGSGPQRLIRALGEETGNPITALVFSSVRMKRFRSAAVGRNISSNSVINVSLSLSL